MPARDVIHMATIEGTHVPGPEGLTGSFEPGKAAEVVRNSLDAPRLPPVHEPFANPVFAAMREVTFGGRRRMRDRHVLTLDRRRVPRDAGQIPACLRAEMTEIGRRAAPARRRKTNLEGRTR